MHALRAALLQYLRDAVMRASNPLVLRIAYGTPGFGDSTFPSLLLVADMLKQVPLCLRLVCKARLSLAQDHPSRCAPQADDDLLRSLESQAHLLYTLRNTPRMALDNALDSVRHSTALCLLPHPACQ